MTLRVQSHFEKCCRLCAEEQDVTIMLFSAEAQDILLRDKLSKHFSLKIQEDDKLPKNICINCINKVQTVYEIIEGVQKAQKVLQNYCEEHFKPVDTTEDVLKLFKDASPKLTYDDDVTLKLISPEEYPEEVTSMKSKVSTNEVSFNNDDTTNDKKGQELKQYTYKYQRELALSLAHQNKCHVCSKTFKIRSEFVQHLKEHKSVGMCQLCGRRFRSETAYTTHMTGHMSKKTFTCNICGKSYGNWSSLRIHGITHSNERPYKCEYCEKTFKRCQGLKIHRNNHTSDRPYKCTVRHKCLAGSGNCYSHKMCMHANQNLEVAQEEELCTSPYKKSVTAQTLNKYLVNVGGVIKYQCNICTHRFAVFDNLISHMYQHTGDKPYQCTLCVENFVTKKGLHIHRVKTHSLFSENTLLMDNKSAVTSKKDCQTQKT